MSEAHKQLLALLEQAVNQHGEVSPDTIAAIQGLAKETPAGDAARSPGCTPYAVACLR
jgi:hypothetical protein